MDFVEWLEAPLRGCGSSNLGPWHWHWHWGYQQLKVEGLDVNVREIHVKGLICLAEREHVAQVLDLLVGLG
jgi:hypothetical protein